LDFSKLQKGVAFLTRRAADMQRSMGNYLDLYVFRDGVEVNLIMFVSWEVDMNEAD
jgi:hypothetical protein